MINASVPIDERTAGEEPLEPPLDALPGGVPLPAALVLALRQVLYQFTGAALGVFLARNLAPSDYGLYGVCNFLFFLFLALGDLGLGAGLIRQPSPPEAKELRLSFTVRQLIDLTVFGAVCLFSEKLAALYGLPLSSGWLFLMVSGAAFISSFQIIPTVLLERSLRFKAVAGIEIFQILIQAIVVSGMVLGGFGPVSFGLGLIAYALSGAIIGSVVCRWPVGWHLSRSELRNRLPYSLPFQSAGALTLARDGFTPLLVATMLGTASSGMLNLAQMLAALPLLPVLVLQRALLPHYSRQICTLPALRRSIEQSLLLCNAVAALGVCVIAILAKPAVILLFGEKWSEASKLVLPLLSAGILVPSSIPLISYYNAAGESRVPFVFALCSTGATWLIGAPMIAKFGLSGFVWTPAIVSLGVLPLIVGVRKRVGINIFLSIVLPWLLALIFILPFFWLQMARQ